MGGAGAFGARTGRRAPRPTAGRVDARGAACRRAGGGRIGQQGDRKQPLRDRPHGRGSSQERVREARDPLADAARAPPFRARVETSNRTTAGDSTASFFSVLRRQRLWVFGISPDAARSYLREAFEKSETTHRRTPRRLRTTRTTQGGR